MKNNEATPAVFEMLQCSFLSSAGDSSVDYNLTTDDRGSITDLTFQDLVHLSEFLNDYICRKGGKCGREEAEK